MRAPHAAGWGRREFLRGLTLADGGAPWFASQAGRGRAAGGDDDVSIDQDTRYLSGLPVCSGSTAPA
jgi:hypothetical protein